MSTVKGDIDNAREMQVIQRECAEGATYDAQSAAVIKNCPICGAALQATRRQYLEKVVINGRGEMLSSRLDEIESDGGEETDIYCENDHDVREILDAYYEDLRDDLEKQLV